MTRAWRWGVAALIAVTVLGGFLPRALGSDASAVLSGPVAARAWEPGLPYGSGCSDAVCGKGAPAPSLPTLAVGLATLLGGAAVLVGLRAARRRPIRLLALPRGASVPLLRPPQFS